MLILKIKFFFQVRKNRLTPHYREMFGEPGSRLDPSSSATGSSSAPRSSSAPGSLGPETVPKTQSSQRVSRSPPSGAPSVPRFIAPPAPHAHVLEVPPPVPPPMPAGDSSRFEGAAECSLDAVHCRRPSRSARQKRFISPRPRPTGRNFVVRYIFF